MSDQDKILLSQLTEAISRCAAAHPPIEHALHPDVSRMADLLGLMIYFQVSTYPIAEIEPEVLEVYRRWQTF
ncbi:hypothetical protein ACMYR3_17035 (plasmid) [Ampullimonas aquatilis]|uniref:hypothetical protein n=1 Tax=Ampullimonas aquatilis TaxID=1341549 RepID=UPI003C749D70